MSEYDVGQLAYLFLLGIAVGGYFLAQGRRELGRMSRHAVLWVLIFVGVIAGFGLWGDIRNDIAPRQSVIGTGIIEVPRSQDGHYYLTAMINETPVKFVIDTGATDIVLTQADADRIGINAADLVFSRIANTANGTVKTARTKVDSFQLGGITDRGISVSVNQGEMDGSLLGMAYLQRFQKIEIAGQMMVLTR